jgi:hypothetical protein
MREGKSFKNKIKVFVWLTYSSILDRDPGSSFFSCNFYVASMDTYLIYAPGFSVYLQSYLFTSSFIPI